MGRADRALLAHEVVLLSRQGMSRRAIARALGIGRNTVREVLKKQETARAAEHQALPAAVRRPQPSKLDGHRDKVQKLLDTFDDITAKRVHEELTKGDFDCGYTIVKDLVRKLRPKPKPKVSLPTPSYEPGQMAECDWSPYRIRFTHAPTRKLHAFGYVLPFSRRKCFSFHECENLYALMDGHVQAFERNQGVARVCKYDNQKTVVLRWEGKQPIYNPHFIAFATYYEFRPQACRPYHPNDKPRVERSFWELVRSFFNGREFADEQDLRRQLVEWMNDISDQRKPRGLDCTVLERFEQERSALLPLPRHPYDTARVVYRVCDLEGCIRWNGNIYEVPYDRVTDILPVRVTATELHVYAPDLECVVSHELRRKGAGERAELPGRSWPRKRKGPDIDQLRLTYQSLSEQAAAFFERLLRAQPRSAGYHARKILALRERYDTVDLSSALSHALSYDTFDHHTIERIVTRRSTPRRLEEYVAEAQRQKLEALAQESRAEPPSLEEYDELPCFSVSTSPPEPESAICPESHPKNRPSDPPRPPQKSSFALGSGSTSKCSD